jgi:hypothetical protein
MKTWISFLIHAIIAIIIAVLTTVCVGQTKHIKTLDKQVTEQSQVIDSLLKRRMTVFDCQLYVTDKSRSTIYGRYNRGTINMPQERTYTLVIDSTNINLK